MPRQHRSTHVIYFRITLINFMVDSSYNRNRHSFCSFSVASHAPRKPLNIFSTVINIWDQKKVRFENTLDLEFTEMATLSKEKLKKEIAACGIPLPSSNAKKDELVQIYEKYIANKDVTSSISEVSSKNLKSSQTSEFSSDEELSPKLQRKTYDSSVNQEINSQEDSSMVNLVVGDLNIVGLSDNELFERLRAFNVDVGPIVDTTRAVYQRKLARLLQQGVERGDNMEEEYSDTDEEPEETKYNFSSTPQSQFHGTTNQSYSNSYEYSRYSYREEAGGSNIKPRVSLDQDYLRSRTGKVDDFVSRIVDQEKEPLGSWQGESAVGCKGTSSGRGGFSTILVIGMLIVLLLMGFLVYQNMESSESSSIPEIGEI